MRATVSSGTVLATVRAHADRVHDLVRRQGCPAEVAPGVVEASALDLVDSAAQDPVPPARLAGRWFALAARRARSAGLDDAWLPVGTGVLADDQEQELLSSGLDRREERSRLALLLRDAYDLPVETVAAALGVEGDGLARLVGAARLDLLPDVFDSERVDDPGHDLEAGLSRLAEGPVVGPGDGPVARHVRRCAECGAVVEAQEDVRRLLAGLSVVALPDEDREELLRAVEARAAELLPADGPDAVEEAVLVEDEGRRLLSPGPVLLALLLAVAAGVGLGALLSRPAPVAAAAFTPLPPVTAPVPTPLPGDSPLPTPTPGAAATTTVFTYPPTTTPPPVAPTTTPPPAAAPRVVLDPAAGPLGGDVSVALSGWAPGSTVVVSVRDPRGQPVGETRTTVVPPSGRASVTLPVGEAGGQPGAYAVVAGDGSRSARATYTAS